MDELTLLREQINQIDAELTTLLQRRMQVVKQVGEYKKAQNLPVLHTGREQEVLDRNAALVTEQELVPYIRECFTEIMRISREYQHGIKGEQHA